MKSAQQYSDNGEYQKACDIYDALIAKYGFKTFEESYYEAYPEKRNPAKKENPGAASALASADGAADDAAETSPETE